MKLNALDLRNLDETIELPPIKRNPIYLILDNIYDTYNIGGLFRLADGLACEKIYLCGVSDTPPNHRIKKASIGTYKVVPWEYKEHTIDAIKDLRSNIPNISIMAIEQSDNSVNYQEITYDFPLALIVGNETTGVSEDVLNEVDKILEIPMFGINVSLNVIVSAAIVSFYSMRFMSAAATINETPNKE